MARNPITALGDLLFPPRCAFCGRIMDPGTGSICPDCEAELPYRPDDECILDAGGCPCAVTFYYEGPVKQGIRAMKFHRKPYRTKTFGPIIAATAAEMLGGQFDAVTYVPVSAQRRYKRGFDQAQLLAKYAAEVWNVKSEKTLKKIRNNKPQSSVKLPSERKANVENVYIPAPGAVIAGRRFLLIDDVCTTGSTLASCAGVLMDAGAASVVCAALAGGHSGEVRRV